MESKKIPRIMIAGTSSGCGKTTVTCAVLQLLKNKGYNVSSFKCGPDYIDPMFHSKVIGIKSSNLDMYFCGDDTIKYLFAKNAADISTDMAISVIEGVMGFYDGRALNTTEAASYELAKMLDAPVILVVDCKGMANSALAVIKGFKELHADNTIAGVILNNISKTTYESVKEAINQRLQLKVFGYLPKLPNDLIFESRHLGLVTADEINDIQTKLICLSQTASATIDIEAVIGMANNINEIHYTNISITKREHVKIAVANDNAFCFYYRDNLELLEQMGAELVYFSPLDDDVVPDNIDGLYIGGGYPELYTERLGENKSMIKSIYDKLNDNLPCIAECGGFMYLTQSIDNKKMVGYLQGDCTNTGKLTRFGYVELTNKSTGESIRGHEFHYYDCTNSGESFTAQKANGTKWDCIHATENLIAGFPHIHFYSNLKFAENFYTKCIERKHRYD